MSTEYFAEKLHGFAQWLNVSEFEPALYCLNLTEMTMSVLLPNSNHFR